MFGSSLLPFAFYEVHILFTLFIFIYVYLCSTRFPYQRMVVAFNSNTTGFTCRAGTPYHSETLEVILRFPSGVHFSQSVVVLFSVLSTIVCPFLPFLLVIVLSVLLRGF